MTRFQFLQTAGLILTLAAGLYAQPYAVAVDEYNNTVTIVDTKTNSVASTITNFIPGIPNSFAAGPCNVTVTPDGMKAYVGNYNSAPGGQNTQLNVVTEIDLGTMKTSVIPIPPSQGSYHLTASPDSMFVYVPINTGQAFEMLVIDVMTKVIAAQYGIGGSPGRIAVSPDGMSLWMPYLGDTKVDVVNPATGARLTEYDLGSKVDALVFSPDGTTVYVTSEQVASIFAIDVASGKVTTISSAAPGAKGTPATFIDLAVTPDGKRLFVTQSPSQLNNIEVIDLTSGAVITPFPENPFGVDSANMPFALSPDGATIYTLDANPKADDISAWSTSSFAMLAKNVLDSPQKTYFVCGMAAQPAAPAKPAAPVITAVVNDASFLPPITASGWVAIGGTNLSKTTRSWGLADFVGNQLPTKLNDVSVTINGIPAYVYYISSAQINVLAPDDATTGPVAVQVTNAAGVSNSFMVAKAAFSPAFFAFDGTHVVATHTDGSLIGPPGLVKGIATTPAQPGETIVLYATGFGPGNPALPAGLTVAAPSQLANPATAKVGGQAAQVLFAGIIGSGLDQINMVVPTVPNGDIPIVAAVGGIQSPAGFVLTVHQ